MQKLSKIGMETIQNSNLKNSYQVKNQIPEFLYMITISIFTFTERLMIVPYSHVLN